MLRSFRAGAAPLAAVIALMLPADPASAVQATLSCALVSGGEKAEKKKMLFSIDEDVWGVALTGAGNFDLISPGVTVEPMRILLDSRMFAPEARNPITIHRQTLRMELIAKDERGMTREVFSGVCQTSKFVPVRKF